MLRRLRALLARLTNLTVTPPSPAADSALSPSAPATASAPGEATDPALATLIAAATEAPTEAPASPGVTPLSSADLQLSLERIQGLVASHKHDRAIALLEDLLRTYPDPEVAMMLDELRTIRRSAKRLRRQPRDPYAHFELGRALFAQERGEEALSHLEQACRLRPAWLEPHLLRAYELHWQARWREAEAAYRTVLTIDANHPTARLGLNAVRLCQPPDALMASTMDRAAGLPIPTIH